MSNNSIAGKNQNIATIVAIAFAILAPIIPAILLLASANSFGAISDLPEYYCAAKLALGGAGAKIYELAYFAAFEQAMFPELSGRIIGFYVPPIAVPLFWFVGVFSVGAAKLLWPRFLLLLLLISFALLSRMYSLTFKQRLWLFAVLSLSGPIYETLRIGQIAPLLLLSFVGSLYYLSKNRPLASGLCLVGMLLKPQELLPVLIFLLAARQYKAILGFCAAAITTGIISWPLIGAEGYANYFKLLSYSSVHSELMQPELGPTLRGQLLRLVPGFLGQGAAAAPDAQLIQYVSLASLVILVLALGFIGYAGMKLSAWAQTDESLSGSKVAEALTLIMPLGLVTALHCHIYDLVLLIPCLIMLGIKHSAKPLEALGLMLGLMPFLLPFYIYIHYDYLLKGGMVNPLFVLLLILAGYTGMKISMKFQRVSLE